MAMRFKYDSETRCITVYVWRHVLGDTEVLGVTPSVMRAYRTDDIVWDVISNVEGIKVEVKNFTRVRQREIPMVKPPKGGDTKTKKGAHIKAKVDPDTDTGDFKYEIYLDGKIAFDPVVQIRE
jgi:hypothetical protein